MRTACAVILSVLLLLVSACAQKVNDPADVRAIKKSVEDFAKAVNASDADGIAALMSDQAIFADNHFPISVGKEAIRSLFQAFFDQFKFDFSVVAEDVRVAGDHAVARGSYTLKLTTEAQGVAPMNESGSGIMIFSRHNDGSWKWDWTVVNSNQPMPGSTASGEDEQALYQLERDWVQANVKNDAAALDKILANDFQANYGDFVGSKKQLLADLKSGRTKTESNVNSEMRAFVLGETAVVHGIATINSSTAGKDTSGRWSYTDVFAKRDGRWQCVTGYSTKVQ